VPHFVDGVFNHLKTDAVHQVTHPADVGSAFPVRKALFHLWRG
jgi:hypothetical protein